MNDSLLYKLSSGKPPKFIYFISNTLKMLIPNAFYRYKLKSTLAQLQYRSDKDLSLIHISAAISEIILGMKNGLYLGPFSL